MAYDPNQKSSLINQALGGANPQGYSGTFQNAFRELGHAPGGAQTPIDPQVVTQGTEVLADNFINKYYEKYGKLPESSMVSDFVGKHLDQRFAKDYIQGNITSPGVAANLVNPYLENMATQQAAPDPTKITENTNKQLESIYGQLQESAISEVRRNFAPQRTRAVEEEAALGRLRSGVSADSRSAIGTVDANEGNALSGVIGDILGQKASGTIDLTKFGETLAAGERRAKESGNQFNQTMALNKSQYQDQMDFQNKGLALSEMLGRLQAEGRKKDPLDYLETGIGAVQLGMAGYSASKGGKK